MTRRSTRARSTADSANATTAAAASPAAATRASHSSSAAAAAPDERASRKRKGSPSAEVSAPARSRRSTAAASAAAAKPDSENADDDASEDADGSAGADDGEQSSDADQEQEAGDDDEDGEEVDEGPLTRTGSNPSCTLTHSSSGRVHYRGSLNAENEPEGGGQLFFPDGSSLHGHFVAGQVEGEATYMQADGSRIVGPYSSGELSGLVREYDEDSKLTFQGLYADSVRQGQGTLMLPDGGRLEGSWVAGVFQGKDNKYVYPPGLSAAMPGMEASLRGEWRNGEMKRARFFLGENPADDVGELPSDSAASVAAASASAASSASSSSRRSSSAASTTAAKPVYYCFDESTSTRISRTPLLRDPYERLLTFVAPSSIPHSGEGLFARRPLPADCVVSWYSGTRAPAPQAERRKWEENGNTISLIDDSLTGERGDVDIDVPAAYVSTESYCASLGHKVNHHCNPALRNVAYALALHPRFGLIKSIRTIRPVAVGEELLVDYGYQLKRDAQGRIKSMSGPAWYRAAQKAEEERRIREEEGVNATTTKAKSASKRQSATAAVAAKPAAEETTAAPVPSVAGDSRAASE